MDALIWPGVVVVCVIAAFLIFRPAFLTLIGRISKAGKEGVTFSEEGSQDRKSGNLPPAQLSFPELMNMPISATVLEREKYIKEQLHDFNLQNDSEKINALIRVTALAKIETEFTNIAHAIFGSQVDLMIQLAGTPNGSTLSHAETIFKQAQEVFPEIHSERDLDTWTKYLISNNLITIENNKINLTRIGADFLKFLVDARLAYPRKG